MPDLAAALRKSLAAFLPVGVPLCVAYSGGRDSTALLHVAATAGLNRPVRAVHVHHGLHSEAGAWAAHCRDQGRCLGVAVTVRNVAIPAIAAGGLEAAAREARYAVLAEELGEKECLVTAHHLDDQFETLLLRLLRGAGPAGLAGIREFAPFARGYLLRPWLGRRRDEIADYAASHSLSWIDDPSNEDVDLDRNYLRRRVVPLIESRWPSAAVTGARAARLCADATRLLGELADQDLEGAVTGDSLELAAIRELDEPRQANLLRRFLQRIGVTPPPEARLRDGLRQLLSEREDASPCLAWGGVQLRRYRERLYLLRADPDSAEAPRDWDGRGVLRLGELSGELSLQPATGSGIDARLAAAGLKVRFRQGGEVIRPVGDPHHRRVKQLLQEAGILPWMRAHVPFLYVGDTLAAVGDLWLADEVRAAPAAQGFEIDWKPGAALR